MNLPSSSVSKGQAILRSASCIKLRWLGLSTTRFCACQSQESQGLEKEKRTVVPHTVSGLEFFESSVLKRKKVVFQSKEGRTDCHTRENLYFSCLRTATPMCTCVTRPASMDRGSPCPLSHDLLLPGQCLWSTFTKSILFFNCCHSYETNFLTAVQSCYGHYWSIPEDMFPKSSIIQRLLIQRSSLIFKAFKGFWFSFFKVLESF